MYSTLSPMSSCNLRKQACSGVSFAKIGPPGKLPAGVSPEHGWSVPRRLAFARQLATGFAEGGAYAQAWSEALPEIATDYPGLDLEPQMGLVPIGRDDFSGLWEFWHVASGERPVRDRYGMLQMTAESGIVLVLVPQGSFLMGAQWKDDTLPNYDPDSERVAGVLPFEDPVHRVETPAYFLSKYELTQGQWYRIQGTTPSISPSEMLAAKPDTLARRKCAQRCARSMPSQRVKAGLCASAESRRPSAGSVLSRTIDAARAARRSETAGAAAPSGRAA